MTDLPASLMMTDKENRVYEMEWLERDITKRALRVRQCPTALNDLEIEYLQGVASTWKEEL